MAFETAIYWIAIIYVVLVLAIAGYWIHFWLSGKVVKIIDLTGIFKMEK